MGFMAIGGREFDDTIFLSAIAMPILRQACEDELYARNEERSHA